MYDDMKRENQDLRRDLEQNGNGGMSSCNDQSLANLDDDCDIKLFGVYFFCRPKEGGEEEPHPADYDNYDYDDQPQDY